MQDLIINENIETKCISKFKYLGFTQDSSSEEKIKKIYTIACIKLHTIFLDINKYKEVKYEIFITKKYNDVWNGNLGNRQKDQK